jgi:hypothetical protein
MRGVEDQHGASSRLRITALVSDPPNTGEPKAAMAGAYQGSPAALQDAHGAPRGVSAPVASALGIHGPAAPTPARLLAQAWRHPGRVDPARSEQPEDSRGRDGAAQVCPQPGDQTPGAAESRDADMESGSTRSQVATSAATAAEDIRRTYACTQPDRDRGLSCDGVRRVTWCKSVLPAGNAQNPSNAGGSDLPDTCRIRGLLVHIGSNAFRCVQGGLEGWEPA